MDRRGQEDGAILNVLLSAKQPISSAECTSRIAEKRDLDISVPDLAPG